jgi:hypothetical protein
MKVTTKKLFRSGFADVSLTFYGEEQIKATFGRGSRIQKAWDGFLMNEFRPYVALETGTLINSAVLNTVIGNGEIVYYTPYSKRLYYNPQYKFSTAANKKAGGFWDRRAMNDRFEVWNAFYAKLIAKEF